MRVNGASSPTVQDRGPLTENSGETLNTQEGSQAQARPLCLALELSCIGKNLPFTDSLLKV